MRSPVCLYVPPPKWLFNHLVDFHEIQKRGHVTEDDIYAIIFNPIASTILKWQRFKLLRRMQNLHESALDQKR
jgi:hypothetical protein